ncbi:hypothetical protein HOA59_03525 [archaeon]|jgi:hypothetical protein|nr:hypothetical protein [archaeon]MBT6824468.1 hypothetical protein [archaeon]MBT7106853.1 hypothetical protein [archaeon]MBT7297797.1 hypothetical protein [archaeon]
MSESIPICSGLKLKWKGPFDMDELYKSIKYWLDYNGYGDERKSFKEERYVERSKGDSKQLEIGWKAEKQVGDYFSYVIELTYFVIGLKKIKIQKDGKEFTTSQADLELRLSAKLVKDPKNKWKNEIMRGFYERFIIPQRIEDHKIALYQKIYSLHDEIKTFLELHKY